MTKIAVGLVHWPIKDKLGKIVATNVTNLDVHDIARACRTYGVDRYFIINPLKEQQMFVHRILDHWRTGVGASYNAMRHTALTMVDSADSLEHALRLWGEEKPLVVGTSAKGTELPTMTFKALREQFLDREGADRPVFLVFGTGYGLAPEALAQCEVLLEPIRGASKDDYRHLSVRSAVSICLDRLLGAW